MKASTLYLKGLFTLFIVAGLLLHAGNSFATDSYVKINDLNYQAWIAEDPKVLIPDFEKGCRAVEVYLNSQNKEFFGEDCVSNLFIATTFINNINQYFDSLEQLEQRALAARQAVTEKYDKVLLEVIQKAIDDGKASSQKENVNLIYTVILTVSKDIVADYYHNVIADPEEAKSAYLLAGTEDGKRIYRSGEYKTIYEKIEATK